MWPLPIKEIKDAVSDMHCCCCCWSLLLLWVSVSALFAAPTALPTLPIGICVVTEPVALTFECQLAAFGGYLPHSDETSSLSEVRAVAVAHDPGMRACSAPAIDPETIPESYDDAIVVVQRGECAFQDKLAQLVAQRGSGSPHAMVLVNSEDSLLQLGGLTYEDTLNAAFAVSVKKSDGDRLLQLVQKQRESDSGSGAAAVKLSITTRTPRMLQALQRIQYLLHTNFPLIAYETFMDEIPPVMRDFDALLRDLNDCTTLDGGPEDPTLSSNRNWIDFFHQCALGFTSQWEFTSTASLHAAVAAASLLASQPTDGDSIAEEAAVIWQLAAHKLAESGYYAEAQFCLEQQNEREVDGAAQCQLAFIKFLRGDITTSIPLAKRCLETTSAGVNISATSLDVAHDNLVRLASLDVSSDDLLCLKQAADEFSSHKQPGNQRHRRQQQFEFRSKFVEELFHSLTIMGVFLDELGAFNESLKFFRHASQLCPDDVSLQLRQALAVPVVFGSSAEIAEFYEQLEAKIENLAATAKKRQPRTKEFVLSSITGSEYAEALSPMQPEHTTYLQYTITPPTMFIGYQGVDVLPIQRAIYNLRNAMHPSLQSEPSPGFLIPATSDKPHDTSASPDQRRRIAFISTWFRNHSVGKLLLGVVQRLDRAKFHVAVYRCVHFLRNSDELTAQFREVADSFVDLPVNHEDALALLRHDAIDVAVFPELGMDEWTVLLSHHRVAPVQCVFWGHPITTGNPAIDYFISSEYFVSDSPRGSDRSSSVREQERGGELAYHDANFSEQVVLFRGLSTFFTRPSLPKLNARLTRSMLHLPENQRLYVCPQTLMKLHPDFDVALARILENDPLACIILLASETQSVWKSKLRKRFRQSLGHNSLRRVLFVSTLPYAEFMALLSFADVILDPFPFGGGVTTLDALALGIPVVTLPSAQTVVQLAAGFLRYMDVTQTIAHSVSEFVDIAVAVAANADNVRDRLHIDLLERHSAIYDDAASVDDWNAFLAHVSAA